MDGEQWKWRATWRFDCPACSMPTAWFLSAFDNLGMTAWRQLIYLVFSSYKYREPKDMKRSRAKITPYGDLTIREDKPMVPIETKWSDN